MLIAIFTQSMSFSYDKFISVSVGTYTLKEALMERLADKGCVRSILRVWKRLKWSENTANGLLKLDSPLYESLRLVNTCLSVHPAAEVVSVLTTFECHSFFLFEINGFAVLQ